MRPVDSRPTAKMYHRAPGKPNTSAPPLLCLPSRDDSEAELPEMMVKCESGIHCFFPHQGEAAGVREAQIFGSSLEDFESISFNRFGDPENTEQPWVLNMVPSVQSRFLRHPSRQKGEDLVGDASLVA